ncbi:MAG: maleylpyruvate isomerase family mycothiol-dependent enzyme [Actinobacteria bacterium]|nr:maleylpyruvate isomerase family mycothiol-dependent enzyme [Actinomycetota bacterium]
MTIDLGVLYRTCRERVTELVSGADPDLAVPATPGWTVHDVIAHLSGISEDAANGNMAGAPGEEWTGAQVTRHRDTPMADLLAMWGEYAPGMEAFFSSPNGAAMSAGVFDIHTHEADLRHALGLPFHIPADALAWAGEHMRSGFAEAVAAAGLPPVELPISDVEWFRARLGRRTEAEVRAFPWPADPEPYLDHFFIFGRAAHTLGEAA